MVEATRIAKDVLHMSVPTAPFKLSPLHCKKAELEGGIDGEDSEVFVGEGTEDELETHEAADDLALVDMDDSMALASADAARESVLYDACDELSKTVETLPTLEASPSPIFPLQSAAAGTDGTPLSSSIIAQVRSQRTIMLDPKFQRSIEDTEKEIEGAASRAKKMTISEASHRVRLAQDTDLELRKPKTDRELHWQETAKRVLLVLSSDVVPNLAAKNVNAIHTLRKGCYVVMKNKTPSGGRFYVGEILDIYMQGASSRHGSIDVAVSTAGFSYLSLRVYLPIALNHGLFTETALDEAESDWEPSSTISIRTFFFSCLDNRTELHTHAKASHMIYNLGPKALVGDERDSMRLTPIAGSRWKALTHDKVKKLIHALPKLLIPGSQMPAR
ncbi:hypothetical protein HETIRDRAFT_330930 [Heterobasidion irregulare TC 32-1]|uniref:Uncharacterized protein n=1 Tax=Heterobasidion irregulare (strain TC 32-1) TaxID=747525 RepID=W4JQ22_HETIT|nr:uncharacterized protein HETIRDRAFT_330930 [Heterobasidion irregulare TC 32-1]ETW75569.1 hypothetical protein HETIRDRAFT_330930 [Heterobasidion irregulare TC 32-1]